MKDTNQNENDNGRKKKRFFKNIRNKNDKETSDENDGNDENDGINRDNQNYQDYQDSQSEIMESKFVDLNDLVYAPLCALAESNHNLRNEIINSIISMSSVDNDNQEKTYHLKRLNIAYEQLRSDIDDSYSVDTLQVQIPLLSIVPVTNLGIEESEIEFSAEVRTKEISDVKDGLYEARICSPEQRASDFLPRVSYKMKVKAIPATEGIMRLVDSLSSNQVSKKISSQAISSDGVIDEQADSSTALLNDLKERVIKLKHTYAKINDVSEEINQMDKIKNNISSDDKASFANEKAEILDEIIKYQNEIMEKEISCVISKDN